MELTKEELEQKIADAVADATKGMFTEEQLTQKVESEVDRRVSTGIETWKANHLPELEKKWQDDAERKANLTAEELANEKIQEQMDEINRRSSELGRKESEITARDMFAKESIPTEDFEGLLGLMVSDDIEGTQANVTKYIETYKASKESIEAKIKAEFTKVPPAGTEGAEGMTKEKFTKLGFADKVKFKAENPELYKQFISE